MTVATFLTEYSGVLFGSYGVGYAIGYLVLNFHKAVDLFS